MSLARPTYKPRYLPLLSVLASCGFPVTLQGFQRYYQWQEPLVDALLSTYLQTTPFPAAVTHKPNVELATTADQAPLLRTGGTARQWRGQIEASIDVRAILPCSPRHWHDGSVMPRRQ